MAKLLENVPLKMANLAFFISKLIKNTLTTHFLCISLHLSLIIIYKINNKMSKRKTHLHKYSNLQSGKLFLYESISLQK